PMSEDRSVLRTSLVPHLLDIASYNRNRNNDDIAIFEVGNVFIHNEDSLTKLPAEKHRLALLLTGDRDKSSWTGSSGAVDFYDMKGLIDKLAVHLGLPELAWTTARAMDTVHAGIGL